MTSCSLCSLPPDQRGLGGPKGPERAGKEPPAAKGLQMQSLPWPGQSTKSTDGITYASPALPMQAENEGKRKHDTGLHLSTVGKVAAKQPDRSTNRCKAEMN